MPISDHRLADQLRGLENCPHCGISSPLLKHLWASDGPTPRTDGGPTRRWAVFACTACGGIVTAEGDPNDKVNNPHVIAIYPPTWEPPSSLPVQARSYLVQAHRTLFSPDASVLMSASCIDAMLKDQQLVKGSLYERINQAVEKGIITRGMGKWAHRVRLDANNPRHADLDIRTITRDDADRAFEFARALGEILYVLPSRMPPAGGEPS